MDSKKDIRNKRWLCKWGRIRNGGLFFYFIRKAAFWVPITVLINYLSGIVLTNEASLQAKNFLHHPIIWVALTVLLVSVCLLRWFINESKYKRLGSKYPLAAII